MAEDKLPRRGPVRGASWPGAGSGVGGSPASFSGLYGGTSGFLAQQGMNGGGNGATGGAQFSGSGDVGGSVGAGSGDGGGGMSGV